MSMAVDLRQVTCCAKGPVASSITRTTHDGSNRLLGLTGVSILTASVQSARLPLLPSRGGCSHHCWHCGLILQDYTVSVVMERHDLKSKKSLHHHILYIAIMLKGACNMKALNPCTGVNSLRCSAHVMWPANQLSRKIVMKARIAYCSHH